MKEDFVVIVCGICGVLFQCMMHLHGLLKDAQVANLNFSWKKDYVVKDSPSIIMAFLSVMIWYFIFGEVVKRYPNIEGFKRTSFVLMGGVGSWLVQYAFGTAKDRIRKIVDRKTDVADGRISPDELSSKP